MMCPTLIRKYYGRAHQEISCFKFEVAWFGNNDKLTVDHTGSVEFLWYGK